MRETEKEGINNIEFSVYVLNNGMKVYLNEDHNKNNVLGAVIVKGGSKYDPKDATGIAHYLEHMLFKGTDKIGTRDYKEEKIWLDSVAFMYSMLQYAKDDTAYRNRILKKIDYYSIKASQFAVPGEFDNLISLIGGTGLNAFTDYEKIVYHNSFPAENMRYWLDLYYERFSNAVFRLFQTELETVYEEKNMSQDNMFVRVYEALYKNFYPNSIYGKQTVLGSIEHLKNPSIYKMTAYYKEYYVANNMALVLTGNFNTEETLEMINETFGKYRKGENHKFPVEHEEPFNGRVEVTERLTPIPVGILGYRTEKNFSEDKAAIDIIVAMLNNENNTGFLDSLNKNNKLMFSMCMADYHSDLGGLFIAYAPKFPFQTLKKGENLILSQINRLKTGDFSDSYFKSVKLGLQKDYILQFESQRTRMRLLAESFVSGVGLNDIFQYERKLESLTKDDIMRAAAKFFTGNYLAFYSKTGFPKTVKLKKPDFTPVQNEHKNMSKYAAVFIQNFESNITPKYLRKDIDFKFSEISPNTNFYYTQNPYNQIFTYKMKFYTGTNKIKGLSYAAEFLNNTGTENKSFEQFGKELQKIGTEISSYATDNYFVITMTGFDDKFYQSLTLLHELLTKPGENDKIVKQFVSERRMEDKMIKRDARTKSQIVTAYAMYGKESPYVNRIKLSEIKKLKSDDLISMIKTALKYKVDISYAGSIPFIETSDQIAKSGLVPQNAIYNIPEIKQLIIPANYTLYLLKDKKAVQSQIKIVVPSKQLWKEERNDIQPFNEYFGTGLNSVVFREMREYRSLAYSAWAYFRIPYNYNSPGYLYCSTSTQADKTIESISTFTSLIDAMPRERERATIIKSSLLNSFNSKLPDFRNTADYLSYYKLQGYETDNRKELFDYYMNLQWKNINNFYITNVAGRLRIITVVGNPDVFGFDNLSQFGDIKEVKIKKIFTK
jgi:predicted Zn-dependent peptidase